MTDDEDTARCVAEALHQRGIRSGDCVGGRTGVADHDAGLHLPDARYIVGFSPVSNPDHLEDLGKGGDELRALRRRFLRATELADAGPDVIFGSDTEEPPNA